MSYAPQLSAHFSLAELASHDDPTASEMPGEVYHNLTDLAQHVLEPLRERFGPLHILSGYRSPAHNAAVDGAKASQHLTGCAADIAADDAMQIEIAAAASHLSKVGGFGLYPGKGLVHVDIRPRREDGIETTWAQIDGSYTHLTDHQRQALDNAGAVNF